MKTIKIENSALIYAPLAWQERGLSFTASGYGRKIPTRHKVRYQGRLRRIYCCIFSNNGTCFIVVDGQEKTVDIDY